MIEKIKVNMNRLISSCYLLLLGFVIIGGSKTIAYKIERFLSPNLFHAVSVKTCVLWNDMLTHLNRYVNYLR